MREAVLATVEAVLGAPYPTLDATVEVRFDFFKEAIPRFRLKQRVFCLRGVHLAYLKDFSIALTQTRTVPPSEGGAGPIKISPASGTDRYWSQWAISRSCDAPACSTGTYSRSRTCIGDCGSCSGASQETYGCAAPGDNKIKCDDLFILDFVFA
jgi:hypothetical protein